MTSEFVWDEPVFPDDDLEGALETEGEEPDDDEELDEVWPFPEEDDEGVEVTDEEFERIAAEFSEDD